MPEAKETVSRLIVIEDGLLTTMAADPRFAARFPFLSALARPQAQKQGGCGACSRRAGDRTALLNSAKLAVANLDPEGKAAMKQMLNATQLRVRYLDGRKTVVKTF